MKPIAAALTLTLLTVAAPVLAQDQASAGREVAELSFLAVDADDKGYVHMGDMEQFGQSVFAGMDFDGDGRITFEEFSDWDIGFVEAAEEEGRPDAIVTARRILFALWDRNGDNELTRSEHRFALAHDFRRADLNDDSVLDEREYLIGYSVNIVMRAAIRPDLDVSGE